MLSAGVQSSYHNLRSSKLSNRLPREYQDDDPIEETITYLVPDIRIIDIVNQTPHEYETLSIRGYEIYIVEQWATERRYLNIITSYTGVSENEIRVVKVSIPRDRTRWNEKLQHLFKEVESYGGKPKETEQGILFITNLSKFPSNLNLLPVFGGCVSDIWDCFKVNLNLRKLSCGGRSALLLCSPSDVSEDKFRQIYRTHPKVDISYSVEELVKLVQICLVDFKLLDPTFVDGLFCNQTEESISQWWDIYGSKFLESSPPKDGKLGPTTVSAILGFVLSCTFRLNIVGSDFPKEPFNYFSFRVNVGKFQKQYNLKRTWYLDPHTVEKLFKVTNKKAEPSALKKVMKFTVHDLPGRTNSLQMAQEVLTEDLEKAMKYFKCSPRLEYLWFGKGDVNNIKSFNYEMVGKQQYTSTFRSGVGKIKSLPRKLQEEYPSSLRKKENGKVVNDEVVTSGETDHEISQVEMPLELTNTDDQISGPESASKEEKEKQLKKEHFNCDDVFQGLTRRMSVPYLTEEIGKKQTDYKNHQVPLISPIRNEILLKRNKSFSFVESTILHHDIETPLPCYLSKQLVNIEHDLHHCTDLKKIKTFNKQRSAIRSKAQQCNRLKHKITPVFHRFELQRQEDERVTAKIDDIQAIGARLEYEIRILQNKIRDTEDCVDTFVRKVEALEVSINGELLKGANTAEGNSGWYGSLMNSAEVGKYLEKLANLPLFSWWGGYPRGGMNGVGIDTKKE